mmetsp:Transcript_9782/g.26486  ORF Transcript_9782/g.26486 Transcript_9782/m.26486 type:complete len:212 (+) Transcript_9782:539-1174(+)
MHDATGVENYHRNKNARTQLASHLIKTASAPFPSSSGASAMSPLFVRTPGLKEKDCPNFFQARQQPVIHAKFLHQNTNNFPPHSARPHVPDKPSFSTWLQQLDSCSILTHQVHHMQPIALLPNTTRTATTWTSASPQHNRRTARSSSRMVAFSNLCMDGPAPALATEVIDEDKGCWGLTGRLCPCALAQRILAWVLVGEAMNVCAPWPPAW